MPAGSLAPHVAGWRTLRNTPGPWASPMGAPTMGASPTPTPFPQAPLGLRVEVQIGGVWVDITGKVYSRDPVTITRGKSSEANVADPSAGTLTLNNRDGRFSPRNPTGPYYGQLGRNTPLRIWVDERIRFHGQVAAWPQKWDPSGTDVWVPVEVAGILRRLGQGATPLRSVLYRKTVGSASDLVAYWPLEDGENSTQFASASSGGTPMRVTGTPDFAANSEFVASSPIPNLALSKWQGFVKAYTSTTDVQVRFLLSIPSGGAAAGTIARITTAGSAARYDVNYATASSGSISMSVYDSDGVLLSTTSSIPSMNGVPTRLSVDLDQQGSNTFFQVAVINGSGVLDQESDVAAGKSLQAAVSVSFNPTGALDDVAIGHVTVRSSVDFANTDLADELAAYEGETAAARIKRLCDAEAVPVRVVGTLADSSAMGPQLPKTLLELLTECADADEGILYEPRDGFGLAYRTRETEYNRPVTATLDYPSHELSTLEPVDDDRFTRNDITVTRVGGSSARQTLEVGALSVQDPPDGIGRYDEAVDLNVNSDSSLPDHAGWRLHLGTVDEARYPVVELDLASPSLAGNASLLSSVLNLDIGDRLVVTNPPAWLPPEDITLAASGYTETLNTFTRSLTVNCIPDSPYRVGIYEDTASRYSSDGSTLAAAVDRVATSLSITTAHGPVWSHADGDFDILIGGERLTVTAVAGAASPQTFTVTRAVNGVVKAQSADTAVELFTPVYYAL